jgi:hypothetical protein
MANNLGFKPAMSNSLSKFSSGPRHDDAHDERRLDYGQSVGHGRYGFFENAPFEADLFFA